jgi:hypothetical protein
MDTNGEFGKRGDGGQGSHPQPHYGFTEQPQYEFYRQGINEAHRGWFEVIIASIRNARGIHLVTIVAVWALSKVACEFLKSGNSHLDDKSFIGTLLVAGMVLIIGLVSLRRVENNNAGQKEDREKDKDKPAESGAGGNSASQNRRPSTRDGGPNLDGGG